MGSGTPWTAEISQVGDRATAEQVGAVLAVDGALACDLAGVIDARRG